MIGQGKMAKAPQTFRYFNSLLPAPCPLLFALRPALCALLFLIIASRLTPCPLRSINSLHPAPRSLRRLS